MDDQRANRESSGSVIESRDSRAVRAFLKTTVVFTLIGIVLCISYGIWVGLHPPDPPPHGLSPHDYLTVAIVDGLFAGIAWGFSLGSCTGIVLGLIHTAKRNSPAH
jgi:hypothetical protein